MICLSLTAKTLDANLRELLAHRDVVDMAELRADVLRGSERHESTAFPRAAAEAGCALPLIYTVRRKQDGGAFGGTEEDRLGLMERAAGGGYRYLDLEADLRGVKRGQALARRANTAGSEVIRSLYAIDSQPADIATLLRDLAGDGQEIPRLAVAPNGTRDLVRLLEAADESVDIRKIVMGLGPFGTPTQILARRFGSMLTYAEATAPDRASPEVVGLDDLVNLYRYRSIGARTRLFAVIGAPIHHSRSPEYHNRRFARDGVDACYVAVLVDDVEAFFELAELLPLQGCSVTIPHKQAVFAAVRKPDAGSRAAGASNTLLRTPDGWRAVNTDVPGFLAPLREHYPDGLAGVGATVVGAGGAARAIVLALLQEGARVLVANRTVERAEKLVEDLSQLVGRGQKDGSALSAAALGPTTSFDEHTDLIVQTTSVGMRGEGDPLPWYAFTGSELVYDVVYTPPDTPLIQRAREAGCKTVTGDAMFAAQASAQYDLFIRLASA